MLILNDMAMLKLPVYQRILSQLSRAIADGRLEPGAKLPSERALASQHGVSLMTARRALVELDRMGLVTRRVGAGTFVAPAGGGARRLRDPHEEFQAPDCRVSGQGEGWRREWYAGAVLVVEERVDLTAAGHLGGLPLLSYLGPAAVFAAEEIRSEAGALRARQTIFDAGQRVLAVREMTIHGRGIAGWVSR